MPTCALAIVTRGMIYPAEITVISSDKPRLAAVVEVRPTIRATVPPPEEGPAGKPTIVGAEQVTPRIVSTSGPQQDTGSDEPTITGAANLTPVILDTEEE